MKTKHQILVTGRDLKQWTESVNDHFESGWVVVPGTIKLNTAVATNDNGAFPRSSDAFAVVLESEFED